MNKPSEGRLVWNHSTHIPGLIPCLEKLIKYRGIKTVTPGVIKTVRGRCPHLKLRISVPICGGFDTPRSERYGDSCFIPG